MEADFQRDYRMNLMQEIDTMTWRRFLALVNNLNPYGATAAKIRAEQEKKEPEKDEKEDERAASAFFSSMLSVRGN